MSKKSCFYKYVMIFFIVLFSQNSKAQDNNSDDMAMSLSYYNHGDSVSFLWSPGTIDYFRHGVEKGYVVERKTISRNGARTSEAKWERLAEPLFPISNDAFSALGENIEDAEIMQELIYQNYHKEGIIPEDPEPFGSEEYQELESIDGEDTEEDLMFAFGIVSSILNLEVAKASAFFYVDKTTDKSCIYEYRVLYDDHKYEKKCPSVMVDMSRLTVLPKPKVFSADFGKKDVYFNWPIEELEDIYAAYRLELSLDGKNFTQVNKEPIIYVTDESGPQGLCFAKDVLIDKTTVHHYRMSGYSPFGFYGPPSDVVSGNGIPDFEVQIVIDTIAVNEKNEASIRWKINEGAEKLIKGFLIDKSSSPKKEYTQVTDKLLSPKKRDYKDKNTLRNNYYRIRAIGYNEGEEAASYPYYAFQMDSIPPAVPVGLRGVIDSTGIATLEWDANKEDDIRGYLVFFSNSDEEYTTCTDTFLKDPIYTDTLALNTLTNSIYYKVVALDMNYNHSEMSQAIKLMKPDTIPPVAALLLQMEQPEDKVLLKWDNSTSTDVAKVVLLRQIGDENGEIIAIKEWTIKSLASSYVDNHVFNGEKVRYFIQTFDEVGNMSEEKSFWLATKGTLPACVSNFKAVADHKKIAVELKWEKDDCDIEKYHIYKKINNEKTLLLTTLGPDQQSYEDKKVNSGDNYVYILRAVAEKQTKVVYSDEIAF